MHDTGIVGPSETHVLLARADVLGKVAPLRRVRRSRRNKRRESGTDHGQASTPSLSGHGPLHFHDHQPQRHDQHTPMGYPEDRYRHTRPYRTGRKVPRDIVRQLGDVAIFRMTRVASRQSAPSLADLLTGA